MASSQPERRETDRSFLARLTSEIASWQSQGIITPEQAQAIIDSYGVAPELAVAQRAHGRLVTILAILGSVLVGLGVILFFASQWGDIPRAARLTLILVAMVAAYGIGYWLRYRGGYQRVGTAVIFLAALFYGAGIHLVAQIYNFPLNDPSLFIYWFLGVLPLAYLTRSQAILVLAGGLFLGVVGFRIAPWLEDKRGEEVAVVVFSLYLILGLMLYNLSKLQAHFDLTRSYARVYEILGLLTAFGALYLLTFRDMFDISAYKGEGITENIAIEFWVAFYLASAVAVAAFVATAALYTRRQLPLLTLPYEGAAALALVVVAYLVVYVTVGEDVLYPLLFNLLLLMGIVGLVFAGYLRRQEHLINVALIFFGVDAVTRYFEYSFSLFDRSLVFIVAGLILLGGGFLLERGRRRVFERMRAQEVGE